jgi:hypothetical protein
MMNRLKFFLFESTVQNRARFTHHFERHGSLGIGQRRQLAAKFVFVLALVLHPDSHLASKGSDSGLPERQPDAVVSVDASLRSAVVEERDREPVPVASRGRDDEPSRPADGRVGNEAENVRIEVENPACDENNGMFNFARHGIKSLIQQFPV